MHNELHKLQSRLSTHPLFAELTSLERVRRFMELHVWAVWDFMSLLKRLQRDLTCVDVPWKPAVASPQVTRFINQIVLGEESDVDQAGQPTSHFMLYLRAMKEVGADTKPIEDFLKSFDLSSLPPQARAFTSQTLDLALSGDTVEVAASFFYGREKAIPSMFQGMLDVLKRENVPCPTLIYYLERHIHVDGEEHGPLSEECLDELIAGDEGKAAQAYRAGVKAMRARDQFWSDVLEAIKSDTLAGSRTL